MSVSSALILAISLLKPGIGFGEIATKDINLEYKPNRLMREGCLAELSLNAPIGVGDELTFTDEMGLAYYSLGLGEKERTDPQLLQLLIQFVTNAPPRFFEILGMLAGRDQPVIDWNQDYWTKGTGLPDRFRQLHWRIRAAQLALAISLTPDNDSLWLPQHPHQGIDEIGFLLLTDLFAKFPPPSHYQTLKGAGKGAQSIKSLIMFRLAHGKGQMAALLKKSEVARTTLPVMVLWLYRHFRNPVDPDARVNPIAPDIHKLKDLQRRLEAGEYDPLELSRGQIERLNKNFNNLVAMDQESWVPADLSSDTLEVWKLLVRIYREDFTRIEMGNIFTLLFGLMRSTYNQKTREKFGDQLIFPIQQFEVINEDIDDPELALLITLCQLGGREASPVPGAQIQKTMLFHLKEFIQDIKKKVYILKGDLLPKGLIMELTASPFEIGGSRKGTKLAQNPNGQADRLPADRNPASRNPSSQNLTPKYRPPIPIPSPGLTQQRSNIPELNSYQMPNPNSVYQVTLSNALFPREDGQQRIYHILFKEKVLLDIKSVYRLKHLPTPEFAAVRAGRAGRAKKNNSKPQPGFYFFEDGTERFYVFAGDGRKYLLGHIDREQRIIYIDALRNSIKGI